MEQNHYREANNSSFSQETPCTVWNMVSYCVPKSLRPVRPEADEGNPSLCIPLPPQVFQMVTLNNSKSVY